MAAAKAWHCILASCFKLTSYSGVGSDDAKTEPRSRTREPPKDADEAIEKNAKLEKLI